MSIKASFWVDLLLFLGFIAAFEPHFTGLTIHEWYTMCGAGILIIHILSHWDWLVNTITRFFQVNSRVRLNYVVIALIFVGFITVFLSGLMISESVLPVFGISLIANILWRRIHTLASNLTLLLVAVHFALHWDWVKRAFVHLIIEPLRGH